MRYLIPLLTLVFVTHAQAQRKLWTWESPIKDDDYIGKMHTSLVDSKGYAAMIIGEFRFNSDGNGYNRQRLLWISPGGRVLHQEIVDRPDDGVRETVDARDFWRILHVSATSCVLTSDNQVWTLKLKKGVVGRTVASLDWHHETMIPAGNPPAFSGWFTQTCVEQNFFPYVDGNEYHFASPKTISLWSAK